MSLTVTTEGEGVASLPAGTTTRSDGLVETVSLSVTTVLLANGSETTGFAVLVDGVDDPVDASITTDSLVVRINKDDLKVLVGSILVDPVRVQDTQVSALAANTLFSGGLERALVLELVDTLVDGLTIGSTLGGSSLAVTATDTDTVDNIALLSLVTKTASLVGARRTGSTVNDIQLSIKKLS
jgi:hypothetical protein